ncbi:long-chain-fatty-acid--CoA ligase [Aquibacillus sp. 3ASR75-11]|uniref:Long-chain-fatty-acid--CoA ligase n=1 Tax=Terrihalobacillus insolitus TaxID=2950438 RepID=A0A9X4AL25_9BACI|nr:long-chain-fatty-acid--CoA ligase [Terrihalobacillus insolitus]MDC3412586.1 long-chain-fatty-acid--CoA ligase [Terrihalobacillus insolitus]MDC3423937.1 long-chain-fatty-acid--CoA ligase [Terrihalobacillus insolitus]
MDEKLWHSHYPHEIPPSLNYDEKPLHAFLKESALSYPKKKALYFLGKELTYEELYAQAKKFASYLQELGLKKGDRVAIMLPNSPQSVISYYGSLMVGCIIVQTNPLYKERELEYQLKDSGAKVIVCLDLLLPIVTSVKEGTEIDHVIVTGIKDFLPFPKNLIYPFIQKKQQSKVVKPVQSNDTHLWSTVMAKSDSIVNEPDIDPKEDLALLQYTGGTTGHPKGVMLTHYNLVSNVQMSKAWLYKMKDSQEIVLGVLPFFHVYGMTVVMNFSILIGGKMILLPKFDVDDVLKTIEKQRPTLFPGAPTIYIGLLNHPDLGKYDLSSIEACMSGSAPLPVEVQEQFERITNGRLVEGYGLTESSPVTHSNLLWSKRVNGSIGIPWPDTDAKIMKTDTNEEAALGEVGEIVVKGPQVMKGYWNNGEETAKVLKDDWLLTGDLGYMNEEGYFFVVDRKKDMIIAGGYNIYPREVEEVLYEHEGIQEAVVAGIPDPYRGETVKAYVVLKDGYELTETDLDNFCRKYLAAYKVPKMYEFRTELPKTTVGKILRRKLVDEEREKQKKEQTI